MRHFANFGAIDNIENSTTKQRFATNLQTIYMQPKGF